MRTRGPWATLAAVLVVALAALGAGTALGVGPLAASIPPSQVADPREMVARSLQATLDTSAVHLAGTIAGTIPGRLVDHPEAAVSLDGTTLTADIRPHDVKTDLHLSSPGLGVEMQAVTVWNDAWYRFGSAGPWSQTTLGGASAKAGVDINPLTFVDRLRAFLATPGIVPTVRDVACASATGRCHEVRIVVGGDPARTLVGLLPEGRGQAIPAVTTVVTLQTDAETLRPARLEIDGTSADGTIVIRIGLDASRWDDDIVIAQPSAG
jgi:hypothetical protein